MRVPFAGWTHLVAEHTRLSLTLEPNGFFMESADDDRTHSLMRETLLPAASLGGGQRRPTSRDWRLVRNLLRLVACSTQAS